MNTNPETAVYWRVFLSDDTVYTLDAEVGAALFASVLRADGTMFAGVDYVGSEFLLSTGDVVSMFKSTPTTRVNDSAFNRMLRGLGEDSDDGEAWRRA